MINAVIVVLLEIPLRVPYQLTDDDWGKEE